MPANALQIFRKKKWINNPNILLAKLKEFWRATARVVPLFHYIVSTAHAPAHLAPTINLIKAKSIRTMDHIKE